MALLERDELLAQAGLALARARQGQGALLLVCGEAGIGKTSLIEALLADLPAHGLRVFAGACEALSTPRPLGPLRDIARASLPRLQALFERGAAPADLFSACFEALDTPLAPSVLVIEDLHWADEATLDLVKFLARRLQQLPLLLLLSFRDDELHDEHPLQGLLGDLPSGALLRLNLQPLSAAAVEQLCAAAGRSAEGLHRSSGGNPFFVTELLASGVVDEHSGVPSTVREAVHTRLQRLSSAQRELLQRLSLVPGSCAPALAHALLPEGSSVADIDACVQKGLLVERGGGLAFRHELARRAVADRLPLMQRRAGHAAILAVLLRPPPGGAAPALTLLAHHAAEAGDTVQLLAFAPIAAQEAAAAGAHRQAARLLATALRHADAAPAALQAELHERWSYEAGLSLGIDAQVIAARHQALQLWRQIGRLDKIGLNLRWLSRLHWYQGDAALAERYAEEAVAALEGGSAPAELAWACSTRSQLYMLQDRTEEAIEWGERAIQLATLLDEREVLCHALNNVGTAELFSGRPGGEQRLQRSLALALDGGFHEQAARVYTNVAEHAVVSRDFARAERWLEEGIAFDRRLDLDAWTYYLVGWLAQLRLDQGRYAEAEQHIAEVLARPRQSPVMRLPALSVHARLLLRRAAPGAEAALAEALELALATQEAHRIAPLLLAQVESAWLRDDREAACAALARLPLSPELIQNPWTAGEIAAWQQRCGIAPAAGPAAPPWRLELDGELRGAADAWLAIGAPHEAALALLRAVELGQAGEAALREAAALLQPIGARPALQRACQQAAQRGLPNPLPRARRGAGKATARHPHGLTAREQQVLALLAQGLGNAQIAAQLLLAPRTVEHHVSGVLAKLGVAGRQEAVAMAWRDHLLEGDRRAPRH